MIAVSATDLTVGWIAASIVILLWNVVLAGQIAKARRQSRFFLAVTSLCGLLVVPAALIAVAAGTATTGRVIYLVAAIWPLLLFVFVLQSGVALFRRHVTSLLAAPIFVYNVVLLTGAVASYASRWIDHLPPQLLGAAAAQTGALGLLFGRVALGAPWLLLLPILSPAYPAAWRLSAAVRATLAAAAAAAVVAITLEYPRSVYAADSFSTFATERLQERPRGDFAVGLRIFPPLDAAPAPLPLDRDLTLADTIGARVLSVIVLPSGAHSTALDSLASSLEALRRDSVLLAVTLGYDRNDGIAFAHDPAAYQRRRLRLIDRIVRRVRPDILLPALDPMEVGRRVLGPGATVAWWQEYLERAASLAHTLRPRTRVGMATSDFSRADSALYAWGERTPGIDLLGFSLAPSFTGGTSLTARLRVAARWMRGSPKAHWVWSARAYPRTFGEGNQERAIWGILAWATRQPKVRGVIVDGAGDYDAIVGLRDPGGRLRPAAARVAAARRAIDETAEGQ